MHISQHVLRGKGLNLRYLDRDRVREVTVERTKLVYEILIRYIIHRFLYRGNRSSGLGSRIALPSEDDTGNDENRSENQQSYCEFRARNEDASSDHTSPNDMQDSSLLHKDCTRRMNLTPLESGMHTRPQWAEYHLTR